MLFALFFGIGTISILVNLSPTFNVDEAFTIGLVKHSFIKLVSLDALDVHPPLYYLMLKIFLMITTFWTKSMFIQILFSRIFSLIISILFIYYLIKLLKECSFKINYKLQWAAIMICPVFISRVVLMRMYGLSSLLLVAELYFVFKSLNDNSIKYLYVAAIFSVLNLYTFYIAGLSAMLYLCIPFIQKFLINKQHHNSLKYIKPIIFAMILYLPWIPIFFKQYLNHINNDTAAPYINFSNDILTSLSQEWNPKHMKVLLILYIIMLIYAYLHIHNKSFNILLIYTLVNVSVTILISLIICKNNFQANAIFPIALLNISLIIAIMIYILQNSHKCLFTLVALLLALTLLGLTAKTIPNTFRQYKFQSTQLILNMNHWKKCSGKNICVHPHNYIGTSGKAFDSAQDAIYLKSLNKNAIIKGESYKDLSNGIFNDKNNTKLCKDTFTNMKAYKLSNK